MPYEITQESEVVQTLLRARQFFIDNPCRWAQGGSKAQYVYGGVWA